MSFPIICTLTDVALVVRNYWCLKFVEFLNSQKSSFSIFPLLKGLMETFTRFIHTLRLMCVKFVYFYIYMYSPLGRWGSQNLALGKGTYILTCFSGGGEKVVGILKVETIFRLKNWRALLDIYVWLFIFWFHHTPFLKVID